VTTEWPAETFCMFHHGTSKRTSTSSTLTSSSSRGYAGADMYHDIRPRDSHHLTSYTPICRRTTPEFPTCRPASPTRKRLRDERNRSRPWRSWQNKLVDMLKVDQVKLAPEAETNNLDPLVLGTVSQASQGLWLAEIKPLGFGGGHRIKARRPVN
jgi:hypothetical protein